MVGSIRRWITFFLCLTGLTAAVHADQPTLTWVYWNGTEPLCWDDHGTPRGLEVEIAEKVCARLGIKVNHQFYPWLRAQALVESGQADMMMTTPNDARFAYALFGKEMTLPNYWTLYVRKDNFAMIERAKKFTKLEDLKPYRLTDFLGNGWQSTYMRKEDGYNLDSQVNSISAVPTMLLGNHVDIIINSENWIDWWAAKEGIASQIEKLDVTLPNTRFHFVAMVSRKSPWAAKGILRAFDQELANLKKSGEWVAILKKYKDPYASGKPFKTMIDDSKYLKDYDSYPIYKP